VPPTLTLGGPASVAEGSAYTLALSSFDPGADDTIDHWTVTWGDGTMQTVAGNPSSVTHIYADGPNHSSLSETATAEDGTWTASHTVRVPVHHVPPILPLRGPASADAGRSYPLALSSSDPGADTIDHWTVTWGDGLVQTVPGNPSSVT